MGLGPGPLIVSGSKLSGISSGLRVSFCALEVPALGGAEAVVGSLVVLFAPSLLPVLSRRSSTFSWLGVSGT